MGPVPAGLKDTGVFTRGPFAALFPLCHRIRGTTTLEDTLRQTPWDRKMGWGRTALRQSWLLSELKQLATVECTLETMREIVPVIYISSVKSKRKEARQSLEWEENWRV